MIFLVSIILFKREVLRFIKVPVDCIFSQSITDGNICIFTHTYIHVNVFMVQYLFATSSASSVMLLH